MTTIDHRQALHNAISRYANEIMYIGTTHPSDEAELVVTFLDSCCWALAFGGPFGDEVICVAHEVLKEGEAYDTNRNQDLDNG
jgi:hypothetical protein